MSDAMSEVRKGARAEEMRKEKLHGFFAALVGKAQGHGPDDRELQRHFEAFDDVRHAGHPARGRIRQSRKERWGAFLSTTAAAMQDGGEQAWAELLSLAMRHATMDLRIALKVASPFQHDHVALYLPGCGIVPAETIGDFEHVLDAMRSGPGRQPNFRTYLIRDPERAVVGTRGGEEITEPECADLRLTAVRRSTSQENPCGIRSGQRQRLRTKP